MPKALARSLAFLQARTQGEQLQSLRKLTGEPGYRDSELARPDKFFREYIGKDYGSRSTEVTSMGYQWLTSSKGLDELSLKDPEMLHFLLGQLAGQ